MKQILDKSLAGRQLPKHWPNWLSRFSAWVLFRRGWRAEGNLANRRKLIISIAPHTSNWDFFVGLFVLFTLRLKISFFGKHSLFIPPIGGLLRFIGGIPVERSKAHGMVGAIAEKIRAAETMVLVLTPEGTRKPVFPWRSGFIQIARAAQVPVQLVGFDYKKKTIVFGPVIEQVENVEQQMQTVYAFYARVCGKFPGNCLIK
ncbi:1-acyl-sn-glycerol-3-phosphate acyltransferase [Alteromonas halophila]|nr:1-acyl-sn-glycerol-3-phosphate acyltransferase [Alteromonas halophila]